MIVCVASKLGMEVRQDTHQPTQAGCMYKHTHRCSILCSLPPLHPLCIVLLAVSQHILRLRIAFTEICCTLLGMRLNKHTVSRYEATSKWKKFCWSSQIQTKNTFKIAVRRCCGQAVTGQGIRKLWRPACLPAFSGDCTICLRVLANLNSAMCHSRTFCCFKTFNQTATQLSYLNISLPKYVHIYYTRYVYRLLVSLLFYLIIKTLYSESVLRCK